MDIFGLVINGQVITRSPYTGGPWTYLTVVTESAARGYPPVLYVDHRGHWQPLDWPGARVGNPAAQHRHHVQTVRDARSARWRRSPHTSPPVVIAAIALAVPTCGVSLFAWAIWVALQRPPSRRRHRGGWPLYARAGRW